MILGHSVLAFLFLAQGGNIHYPRVNQFIYEFTLECVIPDNIISYFKIVRLYKEFQNSFANMTALEYKDLTEKISDGDLREHYSKFCTKASEIKSYFHKLFEIQTHCGSPHFNITRDAFDYGVDFACQDDGIKIFEFTLYGGNEYMMHYSTYLQYCYNRLNTSDINGSYRPMSTCVLEIMNMSGRQKLPEIAGELLDYVRDRLNKVPVSALTISRSLLVTVIVIPLLITIILLILACYKCYVSRMSLNHGLIKNMSTMTLISSEHSADTKQLLK